MNRAPGKCLYTALLATTLLHGSAQAQVPTLHYKIGNVAFREDMEKIHIQSNPPVAIEILPGGKAWPPLQLDEAGRIYAGAAVIDSTSGKHQAPAPGAAAVMLPNGLAVQATRSGYELTHSGSHCTVAYAKLGAPGNRSPAEALRHYNVMFSASAERILALVASFPGDGRSASYSVHAIEPRTCKASLAAGLGNPDLLVELGHTRRGGWWITGSIEQTLLLSQDGKRWRKVKLPKGMSSLVSSYVVDERQIWLAAILGDMEKYPHLLVYSSNGGRSWTSLKANDPLLEKVPPGWLEGQKRRVPPST